MSTTPDPSRINLEFYRKQAKSLLKSARAGDAESIARLRRNVPRLSGAAPLNVALNDAQLAIARENGFASWPKFQASLAGTDKRPRKFRPHVREFKWYEERVPGVMSMLKSGLPETLETIRQRHPKFSSASDDEIRA